MKKLIIRTKGKTFFLPLQDILYCKAAGAYSVIFLINNEEIVTSFNLLKLHERMKDAKDVFRIGQSFLVNMNYVRCILHSSKELELFDSTKIPYTISIKEIENALSKMSN